MDGEPETITDCIVKYTDIIGGTDVGDIQGMDTYYIVNGVATPTGNDQIERCQRIK